MQYTLKLFPKMVLLWKYRLRLNRHLYRHQQLDKPTFVAAVPPTPVSEPAAQLSLEEQMTELRELTIASLRRDLYQDPMPATATLSSSSAPSSTPDPVSQVGQQLANMLAPLIGMISNQPKDAIRHKPDWQTTDGEIGCGRCSQKGHGQADCWRRNRKCTHCGKFQHVLAECPRRPPSRYSGPTRSCFNCGSPDHLQFQCKAQPSSSTQTQAKGTPPQGAPQAERKNT